MQENFRNAVDGIDVSSSTGSEGEQDDEGFCFCFLIKISNTFLTHSINLIVRQTLINPLHPNIRIHILHTVLYTFPKLLTRRICLTINILLSRLSFPLLL